MKINAIVGLLKNAKTKNKNLTLHIRELINKFPQIDPETLNNDLIKLVDSTTESDIKIMLPLLIQLQHLHKNENIDEHLLIMLEQYSNGYHAQTLQLLQTITKNANIFNLAYTYRFLRICYRIKLQSNVKPIIASAQAISDSVIEQFGKSCKHYLFGSQEAKLNLSAFLMFFIRISAGTLDSDFDESFAFRTLQILFDELSKLLLILDPKISGLIKSNLSAHLKSQLNKPTQPISKLQSIYKIIETLLLGNPLYFFDFVETIKKYLFCEDHSVQKQLSYQTLVNCASVFAEFLQEESKKQEIQDLYQEIVKQTQIENVNVPHKLEQIHQVVGHFVPLDNLYLVYSDNRQILYFIAEFNLKLSKHLQNPNLVMQKQIKRCMKNLLKKVKFEKLEQTYANLCQILDKDIRNSMLIHLIENQQLNFVVFTIPQFQDISHQVWESLIQLFLKEQNETLREFLLNTRLSETLLFSLYQAECYSLILQICNKNFSKLQFDELINFLFGEIENQHAVELICSLLILDLQRSNSFKFEIMLKLIQTSKHNELLLHYLQTVQSLIGVDQLLSLISQCQPSKLVQTILEDCVLNQEICESDLDLILYIIEKQEKINDEFSVQLMDKFIHSPEYAIALFNILIKKNIPTKLIFYLAREISNQEYFSPEICTQLQFNHQNNSDYLSELCKFTHEIAQNDIDFLINQIPFLQQVLLTQQYDLVEEITRMFVFYSKNFPNCSQLSQLFTEYEYLYAHGNQQLTKLLLQIHKDIEQLLIHFNIQSCLLTKLQHLQDYAEYAEFLQQVN